MIVGAGLTGTLAALELRRRGAGRVAIVEAAVPGASEPRVGHVPTGPAEIYPSDGPSREAAQQAWQGMREGHHRLRHHVESLGVECAYRTAGGFLMAADRDGAAALAEAEDVLREDTFSSEFLDHYMLEARFDVTALSAGLWMCDDGELDAARLVRALAAEAVARGAQLFEHSPAVSVRAEGDGVTVKTTAGAVHAAVALVCAGAGTAELVPHARWRLSTARGAVYRVASPAVPSPSRLIGGALSWRREQHDVRAVWIAPTADAASIDALRDEQLGRHLPSVPAHAAASGTLVSTADGRPAIGRIGGGPIAVAAGYGADGLAWAALAAAWIVEALVGSRDPVPPAFHVERPSSDS